MPRKISLSKLTPFLSLAFFGLALWLLHGELANFHYHDVIHYFERLPGRSIALAVGFTFAGYLALTGYDTLAVRYVGRKVAYRKIALASFTGYAFSNTLGMPLF